MISGIVTILLVGGVLTGFYMLWLGHPTFQSQVKDRQYERKRNKSLYHHRKAEDNKDLLKEQISGYKEFIKMHPVTVGIGVISLILTVFWIFTIIGESVALYPAIEYWVAAKTGEIFLVVGGILGIIGGSAVGGIFLGEGIKLFSIARDQNGTPTDNTARIKYLIVGMTFILGVAVYTGFLNKLRFEALEIQENPQSFSEGLIAESAVSSEAEVEAQNSDNAFFVTAIMTVIYSCASVGLGKLVLCIRAFWYRKNIRKHRRKHRRHVSKAAINAEKANSMLDDVNRLRKEAGRAEYVPKLGLNLETNNHGEPRTAESEAFSKELKDGNGQNPLITEGKNNRGFESEIGNMRIGESQRDNEESMKSVELSEEDSMESLKQREIEEGNEEDLNEDLSELIKRRSKP